MALFMEIKVAKKTLLVVHGMGQHTTESVKTDVIGAMNNAISLYPVTLGGKSADGLVNVVPVVYNDLLEEYRGRLADGGDSLAERIARIDGPNSLLERSVSEVNGIQARFGEDEFFNTHWLDVILYRYTLLSELIRLRVAEVIGTAIAEHGAANVHVLAHSLGTAVLHDALEKSFGPENLVDEHGTDLNLDISSHRLGGVHMVANVSRTLQTFVKVGSSIVRPGERGCTAVFTECRHRLDPITLIRQFTPTDNGVWTTHDIFNSAYHLVELTSVTAGNVHSLSHYLENPALHRPLFRLLFGHRPLKDERDEASSVYLQRTVAGKARVLQQAFGDLNFDSQASVSELLSASHDLKNLVVGFGEHF